MQQILYLCWTLTTHSLTALYLFYCIYHELLSKSLSPAHPANSTTPFIISAKHSNVIFAPDFTLHPSIECLFYFKIQLQIVLSSPVLKLLSQKAHFCTYSTYQGLHSWQPSSPVLCKTQSGYLLTTCVSLQNNFTWPRVSSLPIVPAPTTVH